MEPSNNFNLALFISLSLLMPNQAKASAKPPVPIQITQHYNTFSAPSFYEPASKNICYILEKNSKKNAENEKFLNNYAKFGAFAETPSINAFNPANLEKTLKNFSFSSDDSMLKAISEYPRSQAAIKAASDLKENDSQQGKNEIKSIAYNETKSAWEIEATPWFLYRKKIMKPRFPEKSLPYIKSGKVSYYCTAFVQETLGNIIGETEIMKNGIYGHAWQMLSNLREKKKIIWEKNPKSSAICRDLISKNPKSSYKEILQMLAATRNTGIESMLEPGDIANAWNPFSLYKEHVTTHWFIILGKDKNGNIYIMQEWKDKLEIMTLDELYKRIPGGIDAIAKLGFENLYIKKTLKKEKPMQ
jgi:hypothetical protein